MNILRRVEKLGQFAIRYQRRLTVVLTVASALFMAISAYLFRPNARSMVHYRPTPGPETYYPLAAAVWTLVGGLLLAWVLLLAHRNQTFPAPQTPRLERLLARGWWPLLPGIVLLGTVSEAHTQLLGLRWLEGMNHHIQFVLWIAGITLVTLGLAGHIAPRAEPDPTSDPLPTNPAPATNTRNHRFRREWLLVAALTLAAFCVRVWRLDDYVRIMIDEAHFTMGVTYFWAFDDVDILAPMPTTASFPFIFSYGMEWGVSLLGRSFAGLRLFSAVLGTLTVPAVYLLARHLYDRTTAFIAALILLSFPPHIHYSRLALNNIADPLFGTLAFAFIARGLHTSRRSDYVLAGVALGLTQYFYEGGRLLYPLLTVIWLGAGFVLWHPRPSLRGVILLAVAFVLVAAPIYYTLLGTDFPLVDRLDKTQLDDTYWNRNREDNNWHTRLRHFHHSLMAYVHMPENTVVYYYLYYGGKHPLVLEWLVPVFLLGAVIAAWRWWTPGVLPASWLLANSLGNAFLVESAVSARYVVAFPAVALLVAVGLRYTIGLLWPVTSARRPVRSALLVAAALAIAGGQIVYYYRYHLPVFEREMRESIHQDAEDALWRARDFPPQTHVHLIGDRMLPEVDAQRFANFVTDGLFVRTWKPSSINAMFLSTLPRSVDQAFFIPADDFDTQRLLYAMFGAEPLQATTYNVPPEKALLLYYLPARK